MRRHARVALPSLALALLALAACSTGSGEPWAGYGPDPHLPKPQKSLIPVVNVAEVKGWAAGEAPTAPPGFVVTRFGEGFDHPRWLLPLPNGDVLVAESSSESKPPKGIRGFFQNLIMKRAGAQEKSPDRIMLLRDADGDGVAEVKTIFAQNIRRPFGMALVGESLYVARDDGVVRFPYAPGQTRVEGAGETVFALPAGRNHHWTKSLIASPDGTKLYATVGSNSNVAENGMEEEVGRAAIHEYDIATGKLRLFASGLRNPNGLGWEPATGALWTTVNERDEIGNDLVPDYMTSVRDGGFYGWPYSYYGQNVDARVKPPRPDLVATAIKPDYALGPHTASLGLTFYTADAFPPAYRGGAFVGQHGSWNRRPLNGYQVVFVPFRGGRPQTPPQAFLTGFLDEDGKVRGRPVGVAVDGGGALLVADDVGEIVWRVAPAAPPAAQVSPS
ncbi:L-sorbosone dehydrogenase [Phenylobacterium zucineum HLK1]|uniref:L-sorbosone dehydrogenase n=1 Tax=Phenylobacterium zucineum (strain HLK1) TaxID=450851 RepID=B4RGK3_PHEZH|nr:sorbosone dehydrogenase family protein [Phenylobacterium zucineum]ACG78909.1 L-sorbosone dehydrogenase [Phenylobacterium zucineum HLK1]